MAKFDLSGATAAHHSGQSSLRNSAIAIAIVAMVITIVATAITNATRCVSSYRGRRQKLNANLW
jgi:hypothetical protein